MDDDFRETAIDGIAADALARYGLRFELLRPSDDSFEPWFQAMERGFLGSRAPEETMPRRREALEHRRLSGVWDDTAADAATPIATASAWSTELTLPGHRSIPAWAISTITVAPTHRRRGIARQLMEAELRTAVQHQLPVAILTASEATIYERFGFAPAAMRADWTIDTTRATWTGPVPAGRVQFVTTEQGRDEGGLDIFRRARLQTPGEIHLEGHLWRRLFGGPGRAKPEDLRVVRYDDEEGIQQGLAIYKIAEAGHGPATIQLEYLTSATDDAYAALWRFLVEHDLVSTIDAPLRCVDEPVRWQLSDSRAAVENAVGDHLWVRILDVKAALEARRYRAAGRFVLELDDPLGYANGSYLLDIGVSGPDASGTDASGTASVTLLDSSDPGDAHRLAMRASTLGAAYLGGTSVTTLARAGRIREQTPGAAAAADAAFGSATAPWLSTWF
jgi:predicted acetyltransferase